MREKTMNCPVCGFNCNHFTGITVNQGHAEVVAESGGFNFRPTSPLPGQRGSFVEMAFKCESGHSFFLRYQFSKGEIEVSSDSLPEDHTDLSTELWRD